MRTVLFLFCNVVFALSAIAQQTQPTNNLLLGYQEFPTVLHGHTADAQGNQYYTGYFKGQLQVNNQVLATGNGLEDLFWVKTDSNAKVISYKTYGSPNSELTDVNSLAMGSNNHMLFSFSAMQPVNLGAFTLIPYGNSENGFANCFVYCDTSGTISWIKKTTLQNFKIFHSNGVFHIIGNVSYLESDILVENTKVLDSTGRSYIAHLIMDEAGNLISAKSISTSKQGQNITLLNTAFFTDSSTLLHVRVDADSSYYINNRLYALPGTFGGYQLLLKVDTGYSRVRTKILNPQRQAIAGNGFQTFPLCVANDSVYAVITSEAATGSYSLDGFTSSPLRNNLYILDATLTARRQVFLSSSSAGFYAGNVYKRRLLFRKLLFQNGQLFLNGAYTSINESPLNTISRKDTLVSILPGVTTTVDQNGPSQSFMARCNLAGLNGAVKWYGDHHEYENVGVAPAFLHTATSTRFSLIQLADNVWNPWVFDSNLTTISGSMRQNADKPEMPLMVRYFDDGSRVLIGYARGKTALDTNKTFISNAGRRDIFIVRLRANNQVAWYKRFHSTLTSSEVRGLEVKNGKAWFLVNYLGSQNDSNFIKVDTAIYNVRANASLMASIDTAGNLTVLNLSNPILRPVYLLHFSFFSNGDLAVATDVNPVSYMAFSSAFGQHIFRLNPTNGAILDGRKLIGSLVPNINSIDIDKNDRIYISGRISSPNASTIYLHNGTKVIDSLLQSGSTQPQQSLLKIDWNRFHWLKRFSGNGTIPGGKQSGDMFLVNDKPVLTVAPFFNNPGPLYWEGQEVHNGSPALSLSVVGLDTNGVMIRSKFLPNLSSNYSHKGKNGQVYISGYMLGAMQIDTIQIGNAGSSDGISLVLDSTFKAKKSFRVGSLYSESMLDMDIYADSVAALAYTAQTAAQVYLNRTMAATSDYEQDAYIGSISTKANVVTSLTNLLPPMNEIRVSPNPVTGGTLKLAAQVTTPLRSVISLYRADGQFVSSAVQLLIPGTSRYEIDLPGIASKGVYFMVVSNKLWTVTRTFIVL